MPTTPAATSPADDVLKAKLTEYLGQLAEGVKSGGDFVATQAPEVVQQMVAYTLVSESVFGAMSLILLIFGTAICRYGIKDWQKFENTESLLPFLSIMGGACAVAFGGIRFLQSVDTFLKYFISPKYFVVERIASMIS